MLIRYISSIFVVAVAFIFCACAPIETKPRPAQASFDIHANGIEVVLLLHAVANFADLNFVAGGDLRNRRMDFNRNDITLDQFSELLARDQNLRTKIYRRILLIGSQCRLDQIADIAARDTAFDQPLSLSFTQVEATRLLSVFAEVTNQRIDSSDIDKRARFSIRVFDAKVRDLLAIAAAEADWDISRGLDNGWKLTPKTDARCPPPPDEAGQVVRGPSNVRKPRCGKQVCGPLEVYDVGELMARGYLKRHDSGIYVAILETPEHTVYLARAGAAIGRNSGKITNVDSKGIEVEEAAADRAGEMRRRVRLIGYR